MILLLSHADTELLAAAASGEAWRGANPARVEPAEVDDLLDGVQIAVVRLLGGRASWEAGLDTLLPAARRAGVPVVVLGGEPTPDAELQALSTAPAGVVSETLAYLTEGGTANLAHLARFLSDTLLLTGSGFAPPAPVPAFGVRAGRTETPGRPTVGIVYYRAHEISGNAGFVDVLSDAIETAGGNARRVFSGSLRGAPAEFYDQLAGVDALVVTVLAAGGAHAATASAGGDDEAWDVGKLAALDVPVLQGLCLTSTRAAWTESDAGLSPLDAAMQVAIPEFDGRLITVPFSFKEAGEDGLPRYVADPERAA